jgi:hypothetical protein
MYKRTSTPVDPEAEPFSNITYSADNWKLSTPATERHVQRLPAIDRPIQRPPTYDGKVPWNAYLAQFSIAAEINGWTDEEKGRYLATSLTGPALQILGNLPDEQRRSYTRLVSALEARFSEGRSAEKAKVTLTGRRQRKDESLAELAADIEGLIHQAYPEGRLHLWDALSKDYFINALKNAEMQQQVKLRQPTTLQESLEMAQNYDAITESCHQPVRAVRCIQAEEESSSFLLERKPAETIAIFGSSQDRLIQ